ncbi:MAG: hypothetical protein ACLUTU_20665 [Blautia faecis]
MHRAQSWYNQEENRGYSRCRRCFCCRCVTGLLENLPLDEAVASGNAMGAIIISSKGDNDNLPDRETLFAFQEKQKR